MNKSDQITLEIDIVPKAKQSFRMGKNCYLSKSTIAYRKAIQKAALDQIGAPKIEDPLFVHVRLVYRYPKSWSQKKRLAAANSYRTARPDIDNLQKAVFDALNGIAWVDDSQIVSVHAEKMYGEKDTIQIKICKTSSMNKRKDKKTRDIE